jgi:hypothetical protein
MIVVNHGGGTNSTALLIEACRRGIRPDLIVFADTGSERPETYTFLEVFSGWLRDHGFPEITIVRWIRVKGDLKGKFIPLHEWCVLHDQVPSKAYGLSGCTVKWKQQPIDGYLRRHVDVMLEHTAERSVERWIGYDADESERAERMFRKNPEPKLWSWRAPLMEWDLGREECMAIIEDAGLPQPGKSACWMCPSMKRHEIDALGREHPELLEKALSMEDRALEVGNLGVGGDVRGLGSRLNWREWVERKKGVDPVEEIACGCYDGG